MRSVEAEEDITRLFIPPPARCPACNFGLGRLLRRSLAKRSPTFAAADASPHGNCANARFPTELTSSNVPSRTVPYAGAGVLCGLSRPCPVNNAPARHSRDVTPCHRALVRLPCLSQKKTFNHK